MNQKAETRKAAKELYPHILKAVAHFYPVVKREEIREKIAVKESGENEGRSGLINFTAIHNRALELINKQMGIGDKISKDTKGALKEKELIKAEAGNFLDALSSMLEVSDRVELLQAQKDRFKRSEELDLLHTLRRNCTLQAKAMEGVAELAFNKLENLKENMHEADPENLALLQTVLNSNIDAVNKLISGSSRLIQLERFSGGRNWGSLKRGGEGKVMTQLIVGKVKGEGEDDDGFPTLGDGDAKVGGNAEASLGSSERILSEEETGVYYGDSDDDEL